ncbi:hypothetical protein QBC35DRAFT_100370 [Podospora australis]|uniref:T6SS Phospholipase effector Tle1-like catalytic domain-containing protein n=1 Tax=Podospora australis TaxID=1536484 RepID=A0AAN7AN56_9PEZI|nr:hypothetical protein QBC35DRAFT_100370 [Podospora australis]
MSSSGASSSGRGRAGSVASTNFPAPSWVVVNQEDGTYTSAEQAPERVLRTKYNHIICIDGSTKDQTDGPVTNVGRISHLFPTEGKNGRRQQVVYQPGISNPAAYLKSETRLADKKYDQALGGDLGRHIVSLYRYICDNYEPGDSLYFFGLSRGAFIASLLASFIADVGVFSRKLHGATQSEYNDIILYLFTAWKERQGGPGAKYAAFMQTTTIEFLGLFDTVALLETPFITQECDDYWFAEQIDERPLIKRVYHAVALTEQRDCFKPALIKEKHRDQTVSQVWFPGTHESVGGANADPADTIGHATLAWMVAQLPDALQVDMEKLLLKTLGPRADRFKCCCVADRQPGTWTLGARQFRKELGSGIHEKRHVITRQPDFSSYTGIPEMLGANSGNDKLEKLTVERVTENEQKMLDVIKAHVDGIRPAVEGRFQKVQNAARAKALN